MLRRLRPTALGASLLILPGALVLVVMVILPLVVLVWFSFATGGAAAPLSLDSYRRLFATPLYFHIAGKTLLMATAAALATAVLGWPFAWALSRLRARWRNIVLLAIIIPYLTSYLLLIYSVFVILGPGSPLMAALRALGLARAGGSILYTQTATLMMLVYENLPVMVFVLFSGMQRIDADLLAAAGSLGATRWARLRSIVFPMSLPSLIYALILVFVPMGGAFVEPAILGGPNGLLLGNVIADQMTRADDPSFGSALSLVLLLGTLGLTAILRSVEPALRWRTARRRNGLGALA